MLKPSSVLSIWTFFTNRGISKKMLKPHFYFSASLVNCPVLFGTGSKHFMLQKSLTWWLVWHKRNWETFCRMRSLIPTSLPPVVSILIGRWSVGLQYVKQHCYWKVWDCQIVRLSDSAGESADAYPPISHVARVTSQDSCVIWLIALSTHFCNDSHDCIESSLDEPALHRWARAFSGRSLVT